MIRLRHFVGTLLNREKQTNGEMRRLYGQTVWKFLITIQKTETSFPHMTTRAGKLTLFLCSQQNLNTNLTPLPIKEGARIRNLYTKHEHTHDKFKTYWPFTFKMSLKTRQAVTENPKHIVKINNSVTFV